MCNKFSPIPADDFLASPNILQEREYHRNFIRLFSNLTFLEVEQLICGTNDERLQMSL